MHVLDALFGMAVRGPQFFRDGWGDQAICSATDPVRIARTPVARIEVRLGKRERSHGGFLQEGTFQSPEAELPECGRTARVKLLLPRGRMRGAVLHLAASGDQGFGVRLRFAAPLLERGLASAVLEHPFYGARRPPTQVRHAFRSISDLHLMGRAAFLEGRALLRWLVEAVGAPLVGVTGYSMGGQFAAMVGAAMPFPVAIIPIAPPCAPDTVLRDGVLGRIADYRACALEGGDERAARAALLEHLARFSVDALPPPLLPSAAIVVGTARDGVVPPADMERIAKHWGCELRWLQAGHVSAVFRHQPEMREAIVDAFDRLEAARRKLPAAARRPRRRGRYVPSARATTRAGNRR